MAKMEKIKFLSDVEITGSLKVGNEEFASTSNKLDDLKEDVTKVNRELYGWESRNLFDLSRYGGWNWEQGYATLINDTGGVNISTSGGGAGVVWHGVYSFGEELNPTPLTSFCDVSVGKTYTISFISDYGRITLLEKTARESSYDSGFTPITIKGGESYTFTMTQQIIDEGLYFWGTGDAQIGEGEDYVYSIDQIMLVEGTAPVEYAPYGVTVTAEGVIAKVLPTVTTADNGKFLQVVDGTWTVTAIETAEGVEF